MNVSDLVRIDPECPMSLEFKKKISERELEWIGIVVKVLRSELYEILWSHKTQPVAEYSDYLEVICK